MYHQQLVDGPELGNEFVRENVEGCLRGRRAGRTANREGTACFNTYVEMVIDLGV